MVLQQVEFIFDENVPYSLMSIFNILDIEVTSVQRLGYSGKRNSQLAKLVQNKENTVLLTRDKDFTYLWEKYRLNVVYIAIHPVISENISPRIKEFLRNFDFNTKDPWLYILQSDTIRKWEIE